MRAGDGAANAHGVCAERKRLRHLFGQSEAPLGNDRLRELRDRLRHCAPDGVSLQELSMGMSGDFEIAIEEGATVVRVGQAIFGARAMPDAYYWPTADARPLIEDTLLSITPSR